MAMPRLPRFHGFESNARPLGYEYAEQATCCAPCPRSETPTFPIPLPLPGIPPRLDELTAARGFAAILVVLYHINAYSHGTLVGWFAPIGYGQLAIDFFFVLSGFVMAHVYRAAWQAGTYHHAGFILKRFAPDLAAALRDAGRCRDPCAGRRAVWRRSAMGSYGQFVPFERLHAPRDRTSRPNSRGTSHPGRLALNGVRTSPFPCSSWRQTISGAIRRAS